MIVHYDFLNVTEETSILDLNRTIYETLKAIHGYRETERLKWNQVNTKNFGQSQET
ncbi:hypothetical protein NQ317_008225 [Molorchus minor]|uniref:Uncharacterized protein n=1 Tax=Molorchus minor TaxID=1323400 RepID=A0ABQ9JWU6_9CUCU|nr:hypothetical protein NQ317_008225 [Molorchus minor]